MHITCLKPPPITRPLWLRSSSIVKLSIVPRNSNKLTLYQGAGVASLNKVWCSPLLCLSREGGGGFWCVFRPLPEEKFLAYYAQHMVRLFEFLRYYT